MADMSPTAPPAESGERSSKVSLTDREKRGSDSGNSPHDTAVDEAVGDKTSDEKLSHGARSDQEKDVTVENEGSQDSKPHRKTGILWFLTVTSILLANFLFALDNTIVANIQPAVVNQFGSLDKITWLSVAFFIASWGTNLFWGDLYVRFSAKWTFCISFVIFAVGSAVCGAAPSMVAIIIGRAICGLGGAGMYYGSMTLLTQMPEPHEVPLYVSLVGITFGGGVVLGPIIGGAFADSAATWRWAFYLNLLVGGVCAPFYIFLLPALNPNAGKPVKDRLSTIDYLGHLLICGMLICIIMAIAFGGTQFPWNSGSVIALFVMSFVLAVAFFSQQAFAFGTTQERQMFPIHFFKSTHLIVLFLQCACAATVVYVPTYFLPLYFQFVRGDTAIIAGVNMLPFVAFQVFCSVGAGWLVGRFGYYTPYYYIAGIGAVVGPTLLYTITQDTPLSNIFGYEILTGIGSGLSNQLSFAVAAAIVDEKDVGRSTGWETMAQLGGPTVALTMANAIFLNKAQSGIAPLVPQYTAENVSSIISDPKSPLLHSLPMDTQNEVVETIVKAMSNAYILTIVAGAIMLLTSVRFAPKARLHGPVMVAGG